MSEYIVIPCRLHKGRELHVWGEYDETQVLINQDNKLIAEVVLMEGDIDKLHETLVRIIEFGKIGKDEP